MSKIIQDLKGTKGILLFAPIIYYLYILFFIVQSNKEYPPNPMHINELGMLPFVIMVTILFFQRELSGFFMEVYSTFPVSLTFTIIRKIGLVLIIVFISHYMWVQTYIWKFNQLKALVFPLEGDPIIANVSWIHLWIEGMPEYLIMMVTTIWIAFLSKRLFGGIFAGFSYWMLESISKGEITKIFSLYVSYIPREYKYEWNRFLLYMVSITLLIVSIYMINRRERWIVSEEID